MNGDFKFACEQWVPRFQQDDIIRGLIVGSSNSGKSFFCRWLLREIKKHYNIIVVMSDNYQTRREYQVLCKIPDKFVRSYLDVELIESLRAMNDTRMMEGKKMFKIMILLDDCSDGKSRYNDSLLQIYKGGRHLNISTLYLCQNAVLTSLNWRNNSNLIVVFRSTSIAEKERIAKALITGSVECPTDWTTGKEILFYKQLIKEYTSTQGNCLVYDLEGFCKGGVGLYRFKAPSGRLIHSDDD